MIQYRLLCVVWAGLMMACSTSVSQDVELQLIPQPKQVVPGQGNFKLNENTVLKIASEGGGKEYGELLNTMISAIAGYELLLRDEGENVIQFVIDTAFRSGKAEAYQLQISPGSISVLANSSAGLFYGTQTLGQLLADRQFYQAGKKRWNLPVLTIEDEPVFSYRGLHLDVSRHFFPKEFVMKCLDLMANYKLNRLHWHLTDAAGWRIEIKKYPELTKRAAWRPQANYMDWWEGDRHYTTEDADGAYGGFYTQDEIREVVAYAARRHITVVPEIEMPGHASAAAVAYPFLSLKTPGEVPTTFIVNTAFDPTSEKTYAFLSDVLDEITALFPGRIIHIGGDEVRYDKQWKGVPEIEKFMKKNGMKSYADVQMHFTNRMSGIIAQKGRRMMGWNEIYGHDVNGDGGGKAGAKLDTNAVIQFWKGNTGLAKNAIRDGHDVINSLHTSTYLDYSYGSIPLQKAYGFEPVFPGLEEQYQSRVKGLGAQVWTEWISTPERLHYQAFPRACAFAEVGWTPAGKKDFPDFKKRLKAYSERMDLMGIKFARNVISQIDKSDFFNTPRIGTWTPATVTREEHSFDVTKLVKASGKHTVTLLYDKGAHAIEIESVALYENSREVSRDAHAGRSGAHKENIQYILNAPEPRQGATYTVKAKFKGDGGRDSHGTVYFETP